MEAREEKVKEKQGTEENIRQAQNLCNLHFGIVACVRAEIIPKIVYGFDILLLQEKYIIIQNKKKLSVGYFCYKSLVGQMAVGLVTYVKQEFIHKQVDISESMIMNYLKLM